MSSAGVVAENLGGRRFRRGVLALGLIWLVALGGTAWSPRVTKAVPPVPRFFLEASCLFPRAAEMQIEWRVEGFACARRQFVEMDHRPYFPIHADDKENRFHRVGFFYRSNKRVMTALEAYLVERHNRRAEGGRDAGDGVAGPIGGIRLLSLRIPLPELGARVEPYRVGPLRSYTTEQRKPWYMTDLEVRRDACRRLEAP